MILVMRARGSTRRSCAAAYVATVIGSAPRNRRRMLGPAPDRGQRRRARETGFSRQTLQHGARREPFEARSRRIGALGRPGRPRARSIVQARRHFPGERRSGTLFASARRRGRPRRRAAAHGRKRTGHANQVLGCPWQHRFAGAGAPPRSGETRAASRCAAAGPASSSTPARGSGGWATRCSAEGPVDATILLSHLHWDHIQGLPFFVPAYVPSTQARDRRRGSGGGSLGGVLAWQMTAPVFPVRLDELGARMSGSAR